MKKKNINVNIEVERRFHEIYQLSNIELLWKFNKIPQESFDENTFFFLIS